VAALGVTVADRSDDTITVPRAEAAGLPLALHNLQRCHVAVPSPVSAVRLISLEGCTVDIGPAAGAAFVENCRGCAFTLRCHQV